MGLGWLATSEQDSLFVLKQRPLMLPITQFRTYTDIQGHETNAEVTKVGEARFRKFTYRVGGYFIHRFSGVP